MTKYIKNDALRWSIDDIKSHAMNHGLELSDNQASDMLEEFFSIHQEYLIETINELMWDYMYNYKSK